jgi:hypothetical protein
MYGSDGADYKDDLDYAQVLYVTVEKQSPETWSFSVKVRHADSGWDHYANLWEVVNADTGEVLGARKLLHPHVNEQPFVRSLDGVHIPSDADKVTVRARCNKHGFEGKQVDIDLTKDTGEEYTVSR